MECASCHHHNEANARFCGACGSPISLGCAACGADQPPGSRFCNQCGTPMGSGPAPAAEPPSVPPRAVRKQVTALFADLVGSTAFGERVDPEAARAALAPYFELLQSTIEDHAGTVAKFTGDGVLAIFGIPEVAEDDALRAVAAGVELQHRFRAFADSVRDRHGVELGLRVGVNTGELVIGEADADLVGDVLNTAARLEAACQPGRVMVGEDTWRLSRSVVRYEVLGEVRVKGKADAVATFQVADDVGGVAPDTTPFVGRQAELASLRAVFDDAVSSSTARLCTVIGAPGVGKTRLAAELCGALDVRWFDLRFERRGSTTFTPIVELLRELTRSGSADDVARLVVDHPEASRLAPVLASLLGHGDARTTEESFWAVRRLLEHLATDQPLAVVVDDIQWAEPLFWDLLDHLVEWTQAPVVLVALARPELRELRPELTQPGRRVAASIALGGLDADTTRELAARLLDTEALPTELVDRIPRSTEGNPLFVRELVQMLVDDGILARTGDRWRLTIDADAIDVPPTVLSLLASRVERLPDEERHVVELASVIGTEFDRGALDAIAGRDATAHIGATIDRLRRKDLIEPTGGWAGDHPVYRFHHVLVRDAAYRRLLKGHRADLHQRIGHHLDQLEDAGDDAEVAVAFHYEQVHRYRTELGTVDDATLDLARAAARRLHSAAGRTLDRDDPTAAGGFAERALALTADTDQRGELLLLGCEALLAAGSVGRGASLVDAMDDHEDRSDRFLAWSDCFRSQLWSLTDAERLEEAERLADDAAGRLDALDDRAGVAKARLVRAGCLARLGRVGECEDELDLALSAARAAGDRRRTVAVLGAAPLAALWGPSPVARAGGRCLDVLRLLRITTASPAVEATSVRCQGMLEALRGRLDSARTRLDASRATAREIGLRQGLFETELLAGLVELLDGDPAAAERHLRAAHDGLGRLGIGADAGQAAALLARALLRQGQIDEADALAADALAAAGQNLQTAMAARAVLAEVRSVQGRHDEAVVLIADAQQIAEDTDVIVDHALVELAGVVVAQSADDPGAAKRHRQRARELLDAKGVTLELAETRRVASDSPPSPAPDELHQERTDAEDGSGPTSRPSNRATAVSQRVFRMGRDGDREGWFEAHHPDAEIVFHMSLADSVFAHQVVDIHTWAETTFGYPDDEVLTLSPVAVRGDDLCLDLLDIRGADRHRTAYVLERLDGERIAGVELFGADQLQDALDRMDQLRLGRHTATALENEAVRVVRSGMQHITAGDRRAVEVSFHEDFVCHSARRFRTRDRLDRDALLGHWTALFETEGTPTQVSSTVLAVRGETLCLTEEAFMFGDAASGSLALHRVEDGREAELWFFDPEDLGAALDELERQHRATLDRMPPSIAVNTELRVALEAGDRSAYRALLSDELIAVDRRAIGMGVRTADQMVESVPPNGVTMIGRAVRAFDDHHVLTEVEARFDDGSDMAMLILLALEPASHLAGRIELFDESDADAALARFHELAIVPNEATANPRSELVNDAVGLARRAHELFGAGDRDALVELVHADYRGHDMKSLRVEDDFDRDQFLRMWFDGEALLHDFSQHDLEPIAIRGSDLLLARLGFGIDHDRLDRLFITRVDDGLIAEHWWFEADQIHDAVDLLEALWIPAGLEPADAEVGSRYRRVLANGTADVFRAMVTTDYVMRDHRRLGMGVRDIDEYIASSGELFGNSELVATEILDWHSPLVLSRFTFRVSGFYQASEFENLAIQVRRGDRIAVQECFDAVDVDRARARFRELVAEAAAGG